MPETDTAPAGTCNAPSPVTWNDGYHPHCQLPPSHEGVDHWSATPVGPCIWAADPPSLAVYTSRPGDPADLVEKWLHTGGNR